MTTDRLTNRAWAAKTPLTKGAAMQFANPTGKADRRSIAAAAMLISRSIAAAGMLTSGVLALGGCVSVTAPDKPIVIELNINIKQEVVYRLAADAANTVDNNPDVF